MEKKLDGLDGEPLKEVLEREAKARAKRLLFAWLRRLWRRFRRDKDAGEWG